MNIIIRKATLSDLKDIQKLNYKLFDFECKNFDSSLNMNWTFSEIGEKYFRKVIDNETVWVAVDNNKIIGYLAGSMKNSTCISKQVAELDNFYIEEKYRRQGIGKMLVNEYKKYCKSKGIDTIDVTANAKNKNARRFYEANGFDDEYEITYKMKINIEE